jgi:hypothetical protein
MRFYEEITNAYYNELSARNELPDCYAHCGPSRDESNRPQKRGLVVYYVSGSIHYAIQKLSPPALLHCIHQGFHTSPKIVVQQSEVRWSRWPSNRTLPQNPTVMEILIDKCRYLPTKMRGCAILLKQQLSSTYSSQLGQHIKSPYLRNDWLSDICLLDIFDPNWAQRHALERWTSCCWTPCISMAIRCYSHKKTKLCYKVGTSALSRWVCTPWHRTLVYKRNHNGELQNATTDSPSLLSCRL